MNLSDFEIRVPTQNGQIFSIRLRLEPAEDDGRTVDARPADVREGVHRPPPAVIDCEVLRSAPA